MPIKGFISIVIIAFFFTTCKKENLCDCVKSTGSIETQTRTISGFKNIEASDKIDVYLKQGNTYEVKVEAGKNLQNLIRTTVTNNTLKIFNDNRCNWVRSQKKKIKVYVTSPHFYKIVNKGVGDIISENTLAQDSLYININNSGTINLHVNTLFINAVANADLNLVGYTTNLEVTYTGTSFVKTEDLTVSNYLFVEAVSVGHAYINASNVNTMTVRLHRRGNVYYKGNPNVIHSEINDKGQLIKLD